MKKVFRREINVAYDTGKLYLDPNYPVSIAYFLALAGKNADQIPALTPLTLVSSEREIARDLSNWHEFKVGRIKLRWIPTIRGPIMRTDAMQSNDLPEKSSTAFSVEALMVLPPRPAPVAPFNGSIFPYPPYHFWYDFGINPQIVGGVNPLPVSCADLVQMKTPRPRRLNFDNAWSYSWNAVEQIRSIETVQMGPNQADGQNVAWGTRFFESAEAGMFRKMRWKPLICTRNHNSASIGYGSPHMLTVLHQPYICARNTKTWAWIDAITGDLPAVGIYGKFVLESTWYYRKKRNNNALVINKMDDNCNIVFYNDADPDPVIDTGAYAP